MPSITRLALRALVVVALLAMLPSSAARAARGMEVAISDESAFVDRDIGNLYEALASAEALNATRMRIVVQWNRVSDAGDARPSANPDYRWGPIDDAVDLAAHAGMRTMLTLTGPGPRYGAKSYKGIRVAYPNSRRFGAFARAAAEHFKGRVDRYGVWNEPNYPAWLAPQRKSPRLYRKLYASAYRAIKAADPSAKVLIGETAPYGGVVRYHGRRLHLGLATAPLKWLRSVLCVDSRYHRKHCGGLKADGYAHHPYELKLNRSPISAFPGADNAPIQELDNLRRALKRLQRLHALRDRHGHALPIYLTESGYFAEGKRALSSHRRSAYLRDQFRVAAKTPSVRSMLQYNLYVPPLSDTTFTTGLFEPSGTPLPMYRSLLSWTRSAVSPHYRYRIKPNTGPITLPPRPAS